MAFSFNGLGWDYHGLGLLRRSGDDRHSGKEKCIVGLGADSFGNSLCLLVPKRLREPAMTLQQ
jgi:hypothetical protein